MRTSSPEVLQPREYEALIAAHEARADQWITPHLERRTHGVAHLSLIHI